MNKLDKILETLRCELSTGKYPPGSRFPSEYDLVRRFDVCRGTANKAVTMLCNAGFLKRGQRGSGTMVIKKSLPDTRKIVFLGGLAGIFATSIINGVFAAADERNAQLILQAPPIKNLQQMLENIVHDIDGIVTYGYRMLPDDLPIPVVYIDEAIPEYTPNCHHVVNRNYEGAQLMMQALWERGHRNIAICANSSYLQTHRWYRVRGFMETLENLSGQPADKLLYSTVEGTILEARLLLERILQRNCNTTAIATDCDDLALLLVAASRQLGITAQDLVITGYGNLMEMLPGAASCINIPNVEQSPFLLGATAVNTLLDIIEGRISNEPTMQYIDAIPVNLDQIPVIKP
ncbi:MAG: GntR family transcriptional regulator [Lentisphaerae bacterium]|nr:GntR family transcriptional regulator [Lentisphaerota bacterium]